MTQRWRRVSGRARTTPRFFSTGLIAPEFTPFAILDTTKNVNAGTLSGGNLTYAATSGSGNCVRTNVTAKTKSYAEFNLNAGASGYVYIGVSQSSQGASSPTSLAAVPAGFWLWRTDAVKANNGASAGLGSSASAGQKMIAAIDPAGKVWFGLDGTWFGSGDPAAGTNESYAISGGPYEFIVGFMGTSGSGSVTANFGATAFTHTPPAGFQGPRA